MGIEASFSEEFRAARDGDEAARERLFTRALRLALARVRKRMGALDRHHLESTDIRQSVLVRLFSRLDDLTFREEGELAGWLDATAVNVLKEKRKGALRQRQGAGA